MNKRVGPICLSVCSVRPVSPPQVLQPSPSGWHQPCHTLAYLTLISPLHPLHPTLLIAVSTPPLSFSHAPQIKSPIVYTAFYDLYIFCDDLICVYVNIGMRPGWTSTGFVIQVHRHLKHRYLQEVSRRCGEPCPVPVSTMDWWPCYVTMVPTYRNLATTYRALLMLETLLPRPEQLGSRLDDNIYV